MRLHDIPFKKIQSGTKTIEMRLYDEKRKMIQDGDEIEFITIAGDNIKLTTIIIIGIINIS